MARRSGRAPASRELRLRLLQLPLRAARGRRSCRLRPSRRLQRHVRRATRSLRADLRGDAHAADRLLGTDEGRSQEIRPHVQSFFVCFRPWVVRSEASAVLATDDAVSDRSGIRATRSAFRRRCWTRVSPTAATSRRPTTIDRSPGRGCCGGPVAGAQAAGTGAARGLQAIRGAAGQSLRRAGRPGPGRRAPADRQIRHPAQRPVSPRHGTCWRPARPRTRTSSPTFGR